MPRRRPRRNRSHLGLWIGLGVGGGVSLIVTIALVVSLATRGSDSADQNANGSNTEPLFGGTDLGGGFDDGSPVVLTNPQFFKDRHGQTLLRVNYELKRPHEISDQKELTMWLSGGKPGSYAGHFQAPRSFSKSKLKNAGTLDLPLYNFLKMPAQVRASLPVCDLFWQSGRDRISNTLRIGLPVSPENLPLVPEVEQIVREARGFRMQLSNARFNDDFAPRLFVDVYRSEGMPDPQFKYVLVCKQTVFGGGFSRDQILDLDFLARGGTFEVSMPAGFPDRSTYQLQIEAHRPEDREIAAVVSNAISLPGPTRGR